LDGWKSSTLYKRIDLTADTTVKGEKVVLETPDKANAFYYAGLRLPMDDRHPDYAALVVGDYIFGGSSSRLFNRVRNKDGLSYGVESSFTAGMLNKSAQLTVVAIANPANMAKVDAAIAEELAKFLQDGVTEQEVEEARKAYLAELRNVLATDAA